jgi:hypothetical protein
MNGYTPEQTRALLLRLRKAKRAYFLFSCICCLLGSALYPDPSLHALLPKWECPC